jgi:hypothetical protein
MALQLGTTLRNNRLDQVESTTGTSAKLIIYTGAAPSNCAAAATGTVLVTISLPSDWMNTASGGTKTLLGSWAGTGAAAGNGGYFRIWDTAIANCHVQGTVTATGGGGDLTLDNISIASSQAVTVTTFTLTEANA